MDTTTTAPRLTAAAYNTLLRTRGAVAVETTTGIGVLAAPLPSVLDSTLVRVVLTHEQARQDFDRLGSVPAARAAARAAIAEEWAL